MSPKPMADLASLAARVSDCQRCVRLRSYCQIVAQVKKREFRQETYWGKPVPGFGDPAAQLLIVGLAPAAHGGNRTGRMFTGDSSGRWLYRALFRAGFSNQETGERRDDGLILRNVYITATARCAPPDNKLTLEEIENCRSYLDEEFALLNRRRLILALGAIGFAAVGQLLARHGTALSKPKPKFGHNVLHDFAGNAVLTSYHPSRQNTQTGKLTEGMWDAVFTRARELLS